MNATGTPACAHPWPGCFLPPGPLGPATGFESFHDRVLPLDDPVCKPSLFHYFLLPLTLEKPFLKCLAPVPQHVAQVPSRGPPAPDLEPPLSGGPCMQFR